MVRSVSWWQRLGAALFALVLTTFAVGPGLDTLVCRGELGMGAVAAEAPADVGAIAQADGPGDVYVSGASLGSASDAHGADGLACVHGHCHHGVQYVPARVVVDDVAAPRRTQHAMPQSRVVISDPKFELDRPPRT